MLVYASANMFGFDLMVDLLSFERVRARRGHRPG